MSISNFMLQSLASESLLRSVEEQFKKLQHNAKFDTIFLRHMLHDEVIIDVRRGAQPTMNSVSSPANAGTLFVTEKCWRCIESRQMELLLDPKYHGLIKPLRQKVGNNFRLHVHGGKYCFEVIWRNKGGFLSTRLIKGGPRIEIAVRNALKELEHPRQRNLFTE